MNSSNLVIFLESGTFSEVLMISFNQFIKSSSKIQIFRFSERIQTNRIEFRYEIVFCFSNPGIIEYCVFQQLVGKKLFFCKNYSFYEYFCHAGTPRRFVDVIL